MTVTLRGITWNHPRGRDPLVATAQAYSASHPDVRVDWEARSLQEFADYPLDRLADQYDLMVIDHPHIGFAAAAGCLVALEQYLSAAYLADQAVNSVGPSNASYRYDGRQWALAIDAAAQVSAYRPDLLERYDLGVPRTWEAVLALAETLAASGRGHIAVPLIPVDTLMCFYTLCANNGEGPFADDTHVVSRAMGRYALGLLRRLYAVSHPASTGWNPPQVLDRMATSDDVLYSPLLFGYSNYARPGFQPSVIRFTDIPSSGSGPRGATLGGTGLAVSSRSHHAAAAADYAAYVASAAVQQNAYFDAGGQPGHRAAWTDDRVNAASSSFFASTLETLDRAYLRPRYDGYMEMQDHGGPLLHAFLRDGGEVESTLDALDALYRRSLRTAR